MILIEVILRRYNLFVRLPYCGTLNLMKTYRIQIYTNRITANLSPYLTTMFQYYQKHGVTLNYDISQVNVTGYKSELASVPLVGNVYVIQGADHLVPNNDHDITMFVFDYVDWKAPWYWPWPLWDYGPAGKLPRDDTYLVNSKPFINIGYWPTDSTVGQRFLHEPMHALAKIFVCQDVMDTYTLDSTPDAIGGNFYQQWNIFKPYLTMTTPTSTAQVTSLTQWKLVPQLEALADEFLQDCRTAGYSLKITQGFRDPAYQDKLYAQGRTLPGKIVTNATGKTSLHCLGKAFDIAFTGAVPYPPNFEWKKIGAIGKALGLTWGGDFKSFVDLLHFEIK